MTSNGVSNVEDADMAECDGEKVVTMMDVLQEEQDFEDDANAVLGASDEKNCTYSKGYIKRQAIYACLTCCTEAKYDPSKRAGVCLACSLNCHENHELVELYTKRNFRCDCGNPKFNSHPCQFTPNKTDLNEENNYNQNFSGLYCTCQRPYPDPESTIDDDEMIQCIVCEDWLHASHLDAAVPGIDQFSEMVCKVCMEKNGFLHDYSHLAVNIETEDVDVAGINGTETKLSNGDAHTEKPVNGNDNLQKDIIEEPRENIDTDMAQIQDNSSMENEENIENLTSHKPVEESKENESDIVREDENTEKPTQNSSDVTNESKNNSIMDSATEEKPKLDEETLEESTTVSEDKSEEESKENESDIVREDENEMHDDAKVTSEKKPDTKECTTEALNAITTNMSCETSDDIPEPQEPKKALLESAETSEENQETESTKNENIEQDVESKKLEENTELSENKDETEKAAESNISEVSKDDSDDSDAKQKEITTSADGVESKTNTSENDNETNNSSKKSPDAENTDLPQDASNETDSMETDKISSEIISEPEINEESNDTLSKENIDELCEIKIAEFNETENEKKESKEMKRKLSTEETAATEDHIVKKPKLDEETCIRPKGVKRVHKGATFWPSNLRQKLCTCSECLSMYKDLSVLFLIDPEDTVFAYETLGKERVDGRATQYEKGLEALSSLDRIQQINALTEYNKMKDKLLDFLKSFKDRQEIVKEEDIKAFFAGMKPKREPDGVYFCR